MMRARGGLCGATAVRLQAAAGSASTAASAGGGSTSTPPPTGATKHTGPPKPRRPLPLDQVKELFTEAQRMRWPRGYMPTASPSYFMRRDGVTLKELIDAKADIRNDRRHELQRDLAMDYQLWTRSAFEEFASRLTTSAEKSAFKQLATRELLPSYADMTDLFNLPSLANVPIEAESLVLPGISLTPQQRADIPKRRAREASLRVKIARGADITAKIEPMEYPFTSYAKTQDFVLTPLLMCRGTQDVVNLPDLPAVRNLLHVQYDSSSHLRFWAHRTGEDLILTREFVTELATYLRERWEALPTAEDKKRPIMTMFGNGRLAHFLNDSGVLPVKVIAQREPTVATRRAASQTSDTRRAVDLPGPLKTPKSFYAVFPTDDTATRQALAKHEPSIVIMEPHTERDFTAEARGYYTVREVLMLGRVDGNAMGSFTYPWLSFGVAPSHDTYWIFNERFQRNDLPDDNTFMPTEPPFAAQGYDKRYIDRVSRWMLGSNDTPTLPHQYRVISHRRVEIPEKPKKP